MMSEQSQLSDKELGLVTELLQTELHDLPHEITIPAHQASATNSYVGKRP